MKSFPPVVHTVGGSQPRMIDFTRLFEEHGARLVELAAAVTGLRADAEDVVQEAFVKACRGRAAFRGEASPGTWLRRIVMNEALDFRRRFLGRGGRRRTGAPGAAGAPPDEQARRGPASARRATSHPESARHRRPADPGPRRHLDDRAGPIAPSRIRDG